MTGKVLVCGSTGFIGFNLVRRLLTTTDLEIRVTYHDHDDLTLMANCLRVCEGMDYVFMCAANTSGAAVMRDDPLAHVTPNVVMNSQMLSAAHIAGVKKFVFISSSAAYPEKGKFPVNEDMMFVGGDPPEVYYSVGWMKRYTEILCRIYATKIKNPMPCLVVRPSNIYGPFDKFDPRKSHVTAALVRKVIERQDPIEVWGTGNDIRDLIYIDDFLDGILAAVEVDRPYLAINIASGHGYAVTSILQTLLDIEHWQDANVGFHPEKPTTIPIRLVDTTLARDLLGFTAKHDLRAGLLKTVAWYKANR